MKRTLVVVPSLASTAFAGVIYSGTDPDHIAAGQGRSYSASLWDVTNSQGNVGNVTLLDLPWTDKPFVAGAKHTLDHTGQEVNATYEVRFGDDTLNSPDEVIGILEFRLKGTGGLYSTDDFFIAELDHWPTIANPIPLYLEGFDVGEMAQMTGTGDVYIDDGGFAYYDGERRTGNYRIDELQPGHVRFEMLPLGHPLSDPFFMGGAPRYSGSTITKLNSLGEPAGLPCRTGLRAGLTHLVTPCRSELTRCFRSFRQSRATARTLTEAERSTLQILPSCSGLSDNNRMRHSLTATSTLIMTLTSMTSPS